MLKYAIKAIFNKFAPEGYIGPHFNNDKELLASGHKPVVMMGDMSDIDLSRDDIDPVIRKWTQDYHDMAAAAEDGKILRRDFTFNPTERFEVQQPIQFTLFGNHGEEQAMQDIEDLYKWEEGGQKGPPPTDKDYGELLGYTEQDVKAWKLSGIVHTAARFAPFMIPAINDFMMNDLAPARDAKIERMLANPTERQIEIPRVVPPPFAAQ